MPTITIQKPFRGWIKDYTASNNASLEGDILEYAQSDGIDIFRQGRVGHIAPAQIFNNGSITDNNTRFNSVSRAAISDVFQATAQVLWILGGLAGTAPRRVRTISNSDDAHENIVAHGGHNFTSLPGTNFWGEDIKVYRAKDSAGTLQNYAFYSWNDNADGDVGRFLLGAAGISGDDDFMSTEPASGTAVLLAGVPHRMEEGLDKILYITNQQYLASYDGNNGNDGTFDNDDLDLGNGWIAVDVRPYQNYIAVLANKIPGGSFQNYSFSSEIKLVFWDGESPTYNFEFGANQGLDDFFASAFFNIAGELFVWTRGRNNTTKLKVFNGRDKFFTLFEYPSSVIGTPPDPRSIEYHEDFLKWVPGDFTSNFICAYGPINSSTRGFHIEAIAHNGTALSSTGVANAGLLKNIDQNRLYLGSTFGSSYVPVFLDGTGGYMTSRNWRSRLITHYDNGSPLDPKAKIVRCRVYFSQNGSGGSVVLSLFKDYDALSVGGAADKLNKTITNAGTNGELYKSFPINITGLNSFYINIRFNHSAVTDTAMIIRKIVFDVEPTPAI